MTGATTAVHQAGSDGGCVGRLRGIGGKTTRHLQQCNRESCVESRPSSFPLRLKSVFQELLASPKAVPISFGHASPGGQFSADACRGRECPTRSSSASLHHQPSTSVHVIIIVRSSTSPYHSLPPLITPHTKASSQVFPIFVIPKTLYLRQLYKRSLCVGWR